MIKILLVDDGDTKKTPLSTFLNTLLEANAFEITFAADANEARKYMRETQFDLLILDILLPRRQNEDPVPQAAIELLSDLAMEQYKRPKYIVGLTAYKEIQKEFLPEFEKRLWTIIHCDLTANEWLDRLREIIIYMRPGTQSRFDIDVCIVTALQEEMDAVHKLSWNWKTERPLNECTFIREGNFISDGRQFKVTSAVLPRMGPVSAAVASANLIAAIKPKFIVMVGICAGVRGKVNLGDVVMGNPVWDYQSGKFTSDDENFDIAPHQLDVPDFITAKAAHLSRNADFWHQVQQRWVSTVATTPRLAIGPVATGSAVVADQEIVDKIIKQQRQLIGVEMELYGVYAAASMSPNPRPTPLSFKGVSDFADAKKEDSQRAYAAYVAATTMGKFFENYMHDLSTISS